MDALAVEVAARPEVAVEPGSDGGVDVHADASGGPSDAAVARPPRAGELAIVEVLFNPAGQDLGREWIEVANLAAEPLDLSSLHLADMAMDVPAGAGTVGPGTVVLLGQSADPASNGGLDIVAAYGTRLGLNNDQETIAICVGACDGGLVVDWISWQGGGAAYDGHALVVDPATRQTCAAIDPFGSLGDHGTPGRPNPPCE
jgi:hypothetical protein